MGDLRDWSPERNGVALEERPSSSSSSQSLFPSNQTAIGAEYWQKAEDATQGVIAQVQPTVVSENRRKAVVDYVQRLIRSCLGCEVSNQYTFIRFNLHININAQIYGTYKRVFFWGGGCGMIWSRAIETNYSK